MKDSTRRTVLRRLEEKGYLVYEVSGRPYVYRERVPRKKEATHAIRQIVERFCEGSVEQLLLGMVNDRILTAEQLEELARKIAWAEALGTGGCVMIDLSSLCGHWLKRIAPMSRSRPRLLALDGGRVARSGPASEPRLAARGLGESGPVWYARPSRVPPALLIPEIVLVVTVAFVACIDGARMEFDRADGSGTGGRWRLSAATC